MLTPQDIENKVFKRALRGYDIDAVEIFLQEIRESYEKLYKENLAAKDRIGMLSDAVKQYKSMEDTLQNALAVAQKDGDELKKTASGQADAIVKDAEARAAALLSQSQEELAKVTYQYEQMKRSVEVFRAKVVSLLNAQLDIIKDYSEIQVDEETVQGAKAMLAQNLSQAQAKAEEQSEPEAPEEDAVQDTAEIPIPVQNAQGEYEPRD